MANLNDLLIVEMSSSQLSVAQSENKDYILEGIFGEIDSKNKNNRIYTEDEYVPQIQQLQDKIKSSKLLGELDHPQQFDVSLKNVSHIIEELYYDKENKQVKGKIRLLDTDAGRQAKALVDAGVPLQISSRAAGAVESNGKVKIKQLFTYDLVADPGFANAELKRVNESYGFDNESGLWIYEMNGEGAEAPEVAQEITETNIETNNNKNMAEFVKAEDFHKYSEYLANEIKGIKESIGATSEDNTLENVKSHNDHIVERVNTLSEYVEYLAGKLDESIQYSEHVAEKADQGISYSESIAEKLDQGIQYSEHLAEAVGKVKDFANYLAEQHNEGTETSKNLLSYVEYLKENLQSVSEYAEYIATQINENLVTEEEVEETEEVAEEEVEETEATEEGAHEEGEVEETEEVAEEDEAGEGAEEVVEDDEVEEPGAEKEEAEGGEEAGDNSKEGDVEPGDSGEPAEELEDETVKSDAEVEDKVEDESDELEDELVDGEEGAKEVADEVDETEEVEETEEVAEEDEAGEGAEEVVEDEVSEEEADENAAAALAAIELADKLKDEETDESEEVAEEDEVEEGNAFGAARAEAIAKGEDKFKVGEEEYDVEGVDADDKENAEEYAEEEGIKTENEEVTEEDEAGEGAEEVVDEEEHEEVEESTLDTYKKEISSKLDALVEAAQAKENENPSFFKIVSGSTQEKYNALNEDAKTEVRQRVAKRGFMTEGEINAIVESAEAVVEARTAEPFFITAAPAEYKEKFEALTEAKQNQIKAQAKYHTLKTEYQVRNFWETRDLREVKVDLEKLAAVNESAVAEKKNEPLYDVSNYAESLKKRFKK